MPVKPCAVCYTPVAVDPHQPGTGPKLPRCPKHATPAASQPVDLTAFTVADLRAHADKHGIDLGTARLKAELVAAIRAATE